MTMLGLDGGTLDETPHRYRINRPKAKTKDTSTCRSEAPFPIGETEERHRQLVRQGYLVTKGPHGFSVWRFYKDRDWWR
jgi:hypothetical protein